MSTGSRLRSVAFSITLMMFGLVLALGALEVTLRLMPKSLPPLNDRPKVYFSPADSENLQDFRVVVPKPKDTFRIAAIGDSFTFGPYIQFDDTYPKRLERWLNLNRPHQKTAVEVINYGVPRYSTFHEVGSVKQALVDGADLILLQITLNDPEQKLDWPTELIPDESGHLSSNNQGGVISKWFGALRTVRFVKQRFDNTRSHALYRDYFFKLFKKDTPNYTKFLNAFSDVRKLCERFNVPLISVVFPLFGVEVGDNYPFWPIHEQIKEELDFRSVPSFDISDEFRGLPVERLQVLPGYDRHPNEIGHRIAAEAILEQLNQRGLLPSDTYPVAIESQRIGITRNQNSSAVKPVVTENREPATE